MLLDTQELLVADAPEMGSVIRWCLFDCDFTFVDTFAEAVNKLGEKVFSMVLIDLHFAESRMLDLLEYVRSLAQYENVPVVCVQGTNLPVNPVVLDSLKFAVKALGGRTFLDFRQEGEPLQQACQALRQILAFEVGLRISPKSPSA